MINFSPVRRIRLYIFVARKGEMMKRGILGLLIGVFVFTACQNENDYIEVIDDPTYYHKTVKQLTDVIVHDIFSPPVASRIYAYPSIAAYEVIAQNDPDLVSLEGQLNGLENIPKVEDGKVYSYPLAALYAYIITGKALIFSEAKIEEYETELMNRFKELNIPTGIYNRSLEYGQLVSDHILAWADEDNYKQTRTFPKYTITDNEEKWQPTPPDYMQGIEPHWREIRPFVLDSARQFLPKPPTEYSSDPSSKFYAEALEVKDAVSESTPEFVEVAQFWDCNPYVSHHKGHVMFATKKITPGGHWIGITGQACRKAELDFNKTVEVYARVSIALADGFISCWDEKYRSNLVRPETYINRHIDPDWVPVLQTPPFPEHTSGHSVISSAAGTVLTEYFGDNFAFADSVEVEYGLPIRSFDSFKDAYSEAAISRLYGGIHYMPAIDYGVEQGEQIGALIIDRVETSVN